ncbi:cytochrome c [uncultured Erwinia sp.]|uniref:c-type cytochrome n=1 Tax=uncultured Erwinia sp. TaxID=246798 RepID=UPI002582B96D|nr:cytochrome c [uncultured Erwinia sp.]
MRVKITRQLNCLLFAALTAATLSAEAHLTDSDMTYPAGTIEQLAKASGCMSCHGPGGISQSPQWPNLAGQKAPYLESQLQAFRAGRRKNRMMENISQNLTAEDMKRLANYFSKLPVNNH